MAAPSVASGWELHPVPHTRKKTLIWNDQLPIKNLGPCDILVEFRAWSINYPEISVVKGEFPWESSHSVIIAGCDGAGVVIATGPNVHRFKTGENVIPLYYPQFLHGNAPTDENMYGITGSSLDGVFRTYGVFEQNTLSRMPRNLSFAEAATLPCSGLTAWNALFGHLAVKPGDWVLCQGTGGVSLFAVRFALAAGARVVVTTSSDKKAEILGQMGVQHIINYKEVSAWGDKAMTITEGSGFSHIVEVGGVRTIAESFKCVARGGSINVIGFVGGQDKQNPKGLTFLEPLLKACFVRGVEVGNREQFEDMVKGIEGMNLKPVIDGKTFALEELQDAMEYVWEQKHIGKVTMKRQC